MPFKVSDYDKMTVGGYEKSTIVAVKGLDKYIDEDGNVNKPSLPNSYRSRFNPLFILAPHDHVLTDEDFAAKRAEFEPTIENLIKESNPIGQAYDISDFMHCKNSNTASGYHMITLRRFGNAIDDGLNYDNDRHPQVDVGRMVTYFTEEENKLSELLNFSYGFRWKEMTADFWTPEVIGDQWGASGLAGQLFRFQNPAYLGTKGIYKNSVNVNPHYDQNKVYGPVDTIVNTHIRDRGLNFDHDMSVVFDYELRSYDSVNPRTALLDLLAHVLACTFNDAKFWGGATLWVGVPRTAHQKYMQNSNAWTTGDQFSKAVDYYKGALSSVAGKDAIGTIVNIAKVLLNGLGGFALDKIIGTLGRPSVALTQSLLSGEPIGCWHMTIGNPFRPIASIGNLILTNSNIKFWDQIGHDGFPTGFTVTCSLKHGKPRSRNEIEKMFNSGMQRLYFQFDNYADEQLKKQLSHSHVYKNRTGKLKDSVTNEIFTFLGNVATITDKTIAKGELPTLTKIRGTSKAADV